MRDVNVLSKDNILQETRDKTRALRLVKGVCFMQYYHTITMDGEHIYIYIISFFVPWNFRSGQKFAIFRRKAPKFSNLVELSSHYFCTILK